MFSKHLNDLGITNGKVLLIGEESWNCVYASNFKNLENIRYILNNIFSKSKKNILLKKYENVEDVPIWSLFVYADFGNILNFFNSLNIELQINIMNFIFGEGYIFSINDFSTICRILKDIRNRCCHNNVLYNFSIKRHDVKNYIKTKYSLKIKRIRLWHVIKIIDDWLPFNELSLSSKIYELLNEFLQNTKINPESIEYILQNMGFTSKI